MLSTLCDDEGEGHTRRELPPGLSASSGVTGDGEVPSMSHKFLLLADSREGCLIHFGYISNRYLCPCNESFSYKALPASGVSVWHSSRFKKKKIVMSLLWGLGIISH